MQSQRKLVISQDPVSPATYSACRLHKAPVCIEMRNHYQRKKEARKLKTAAVCPTVLTRATYWACLAKVVGSHFSL